MPLAPSAARDLLQELGKLPKRSSFEFKVVDVTVGNEHFRQAVVVDVGDQKRVGHLLCAKLEGVQIGVFHDEAEA